MEDTVYNSISTFATNIARKLGSGKTAMNGWDCVRFQGRPLKEYRAQYMASIDSASPTPRANVPNVASMPASADEEEEVQTRKPRVNAFELLGKSRPDENPAKRRKVFNRAL
jgi:hypothetical protein